jgi:hypothetical protein
MGSGTVSSAPQRQIKELVRYVSTIRSSIGLLLSGGTFSLTDLMSNEDFVDGWRIPLLRVHFSGSWFYIRLKITETPSLKMLKRTARS